METLDGICILVFVVCWVVGMWHQSFGGGNEWVALARRYRSSQKAGPMVNACFSLRFVLEKRLAFQMRYVVDGCLTVLPEGLQLTRWIFQVPWQPPLLIPWSEMALTRSRAGDSQVVILIDQKRRMQLSISRNSLAQVLTLGARFPLDDNTRSGPIKVGS